MSDSMSSTETSTSEKETSMQATQKTAASPTPPTAVSRLTSSSSAGSAATTPSVPSTSTTAAVPLTSPPTTTATAPEPERTATTTTGSLAPSPSPMSTSPSMAPSISTKTVLKLRTYKQDFEIELFKLLLNSSLSVKKAIDAEASPVIELLHFDVNSVKALVQYIKSETQKTVEVPSSSVGELLELSKIFKMDNLTKSLENVFWFVMASAAESPAQLTSVLVLLSDPLLKNSEVGRTLLCKARQEFAKLPEGASFGDVSPEVLFEILDSCDLPAPDELKVFKVVASYLGRRTDRLLHAYPLLLTLRQSRISDKSRAKMLDTVARLPQGEQLKAIAGMVLNEENNFRVCCLKEHENRVRCGIGFKKVELNCFTIVANKHDLEDVHSQQRSLRDDNTVALKTKSGRVVTATDTPKRTTRAERRAKREQRRLIDEELNKRILQGFRPGDPK